MRLSYFFIQVAVKSFMTITGRYRIINKERLKDWQPCIVAANHISYYDPPFICAVLPKELHTIAKEELFKNKLIGTVMHYINAIPVRRGVIDKRTINKVTDLLNNDHSILIFPQGTRNGVGAKPGIGIILRETKKPVLPIYVENTNDIKGCLLLKKRINIYIGEIIAPDEYLAMPDSKETLRFIGEDVLNKINLIKGKQ